MFDSYAEIFAERADMYHRAMTAFPLARAAEFEAMLSHLPGRDCLSVCDLPSGGGYLAGYLPGGWRYTAVEPTDAFASLCRLGEGQDLIRAPLTAVPRPDESFDVVISLTGLHHEQDKFSIVQEMTRLLRRGGFAIIADVASGSNEDRFLNGFVDEHSRLGHRGEFLDSGFADLVERCGLRISSDELVDTPWRFESRGDAGRFATDLFGVAASPEAVAQSLESIIGFEQAEGGVELCWKLRRLVCVRDPE